jgi:hypothetical protein
MTKHLRTGGLWIILILSAFVIVAGGAFLNPRPALSSPLDSKQSIVTVIDRPQSLILDESVATFASDCTTPKSAFSLGETVCGMVSAPSLGPPAQRQFEFANPDSYVVQIGPDITSDPQTILFTLPSTQTSVLGGSIVANNQGTWTIASVDSGAEGRAIAYFTVVAPTAAPVSISGRVLTPDGRGLRNAVVVLTDQNGVSRRYRTSAFGFYRFNDIPAGANYVVAVASKRYRFDPMVVAVSEDLADLDLIVVVN